MEDRVVRGLDAVGDARRVHHHHVVALLALRLGPRDLERAHLDLLAPLGPRDRRVVGRVAVLAEPRDEGEPHRQAVEDLLLEEVRVGRLALVLGQHLDSRLRQPAPADPAPVAVGVDQPEGVDRVVGHRRVAARRHQRRRDQLRRRGGRRMRADELADLFERLRSSQGELEELLGRADEEDGQRQADDVGRRAIGEIELDRHPAPVADRRVVRLGVRATVGEAHGGPYRITLHVGRACQLARLHRRCKGA